MKPSFEHMLVLAADYRIDVARARWDVDNKFIVVMRDGKLIETTVTHADCFDLTLGYLLTSYLGTEVGHVGSRAASWTDARNKLWGLRAGDLE